MTEAKGAEAPGKEKPQTPPASGFLYMLVFLMVMLLILNPVVYQGIGSATGSVLEPVIGFGAEAPVLTLLLAAVVTVALTSVLRHFFTDWVHMARVQEVMKAFNKEFMKARKDKNLYKIKKYQDKQSELFRMQAEMSGSQFKPMIITMIVVIPVFAWLLTFLTTPVAFDLEGGGEALVSLDGGAAGIHYLAPGEAATFHAATQTRIDVYRLCEGTCPAFEVAAERDGRRWTVPPSNAIDLAPISLGIVPAGVHVLDASGAITTSAGPLTVAYVLFEGTDFRIAERVPDGAVTVALPTRAEAYAFVPAASAAGAGGSMELTIGAQRHTLGTGHIVTTENRASVELIPHEAEMPWNPDFDLAAPFLGFLPRWILVYSLFSLPMGQLWMRLLKAYEFKRKAPAGAAQAG